MHSQFFDQFVIHYDHLFKLEIYSKNLDSLLSDSNKPESTEQPIDDFFDSGSDPSVSVHLSVMDQKIKIVEIFKGYSSMMSTIWNLPTKMTSFFDVNLMVNDQTDYIILQNGMVVRLEIAGTISFDLSGFSDISLWSQYAKLALRQRFLFKAYF